MIIGEKFDIFCNSFFALCLLIFFICFIALSLTCDVRKYLGLKVRAIRESANMTQEELAAICDVSWRTISNLERGKVVPDLFMVYRIAQNFDVKIDELLDHQIINQKSLSRLKKENIIIV